MGSVQLSASITDKVTLLHYYSPNLPSHAVLRFKMGIIARALSVGLLHFLRWQHSLSGGSIIRPTPAQCIGQQYPKAAYHATHQHAGNND